MMPMQRRTTITYSTWLIEEVLYSLQSGSAVSDQMTKIEFKLTKEVGHWETNTFKEENLRFDS